MRKSFTEAHKAIERLEDQALITADTQRAQIDALMHAIERQPEILPELITWIRNHRAGASLLLDSPSVTALVDSFRHVKILPAGKGLLLDGRPVR